MDIKAPHEKSFEHTTSNIQSFPNRPLFVVLKKNKVFYTILFSYLTHVYSTVVDECKCYVSPEIAPSSWLCVLAFRITVQTIQIQIQKVSVFQEYVPVKKLLMITLISSVLLFHLSGGSDHQQSLR